ncbi:MAG: hypothetical protein H7Y18_19205 [Clostridiaceae bacterium]|nr:hypothetical protein [Clostridiaceae bacterium]
MLNLFMINLFISFILFFYYKKIKRKDRLIRFMIMALMPIVGAILFILLDMSLVWFPVDKNKESIFKEEKESSYISLVLRKSEIGKWKSIIPIEDALVLNDEEIKRNIMIDTLKGDAYKYLGFLKKALGDEDTETSHYAATAVMEVKRKLTLDIHRLGSKYDLENHKDPIINEAYAMALKKYTESGLLDKRAYTKYMRIYLKVLENIIDTKNAKEIYYEEKMIV